MKILSTCKSHNPLARRFYAVLHNHHPLVRGGEAGISQTDDYDLSMMSHWSPTASPATGPIAMTPVSDSSLWPTFSNGLPSTVPHPTPPSNDIQVDSNVPSYNGWHRLTAVNYSQLSVLYSEWGESATMLPNQESYYSYDINSILQSSYKSSIFRSYCDGLSFTYS